MTMQQAAGRRYEAFGEAHGVGEWAERRGISKNTLRKRLRVLPPETALTLPRCARVRPGAEPGGPGAANWVQLRYEQDRWAQSFVARHQGGATLEEVAAALGITRQRVQQIEEIAMRKCRHAAGELGLDVAELRETLRWLGEQKP